MTRNHGTLERKLYFSRHFNNISKTFNILILCANCLHILTIPIHETNYKISYASVLYFLKCSLHKERR